MYKYDKRVNCKKISGIWYVWSEMHPHCIFPNRDKKQALQALYRSFYKGREGSVINEKIVDRILDQDRKSNHPYVKKYRARKNKRV